MDESETLPTTSDVRAYGKTLRSKIKRSAHSKFEPIERDPVWIIEKQNESRLDPLIPVRIGRMLQSPFAYYRGTAAVMAFDLSKESRTGIQVISCGDAHVANFGLFAAPDRQVIFDLNDFDESGPAPWEWDVKRMVASIEIGCRHNGFTPEQGTSACQRAAREYRTKMADFVEMTALERYYFRIDFKELTGRAANKRGRKIMEKALKKAKGRTSEKVLTKIVTTGKDGDRRIADQPPILQHIDDVASHEEVQAVLDQYLQTVRPDIALLLSRFRLVDYALRVVGVGSVGTRCLILLLVGPQDEALFLQVKEADASVLETWGGIPAETLSGLGSSHASSNGFRVVSAQQVLQASSDSFLGWVGDVRGVDYFVRQFRDMKGSADLEALTPSQFENYGAMCATLLARAHSQSIGWSAIPGYLGNSDSFDRAVAIWSKSYGDQAEQDFGALEQAVKSGRLPVETGV